MASLLPRFGNQLPLFIIVISSTFATIDLPHPVVVPATKALSVFVSCPSGNRVRISILVAIVNVGPAMVPIIVVSAIHAVEEPAAFPSFLRFVLAIRKLRRTIIFLCMETFCAAE